MYLRDSTVIFLVSNVTHYVNMYVFYNVISLVSTTDKCKTYSSYSILQENRAAVL